MANRAVFLDRDGTMARDVPYCSRPEDFELFPDTAKAVRLLNEQCFKVIVVTNQSGIARGLFTEEALAKIHEKMKGELAKEGAHIDAIYYCPHHPDDGCPCRKPSPIMVFRAAQEFSLNLPQSYVIGDSEMDIEMGRRAGCKTILISNLPADKDKTGPIPKADFIAANFYVATKWVIEHSNYAQDPIEHSVSDDKEFHGR